MSLGGAKSEALNQAVGAAVKAGLTVVVCAGNENQDASNFSPASAPAAITIGSIDITDHKDPSSNFGESIIPPSRLFWQTQC